MAEEKWYYCLEHQAVEPKDGCRSINRFGPYESYEAAQHAMERVAERNEEWEQQDRDDA